MSGFEMLTKPAAGPGVLLPKRLELLGLDPCYLAGTDLEKYRRMESLCGQCPQWRRCSRALGRGDGQSGLASYCLNGQAIDELMLERTTGRRWSGRPYLGLRGSRVDREVGGADHRIFRRIGTPERNTSIE